MSSDKNKKYDYRLIQDESGWTAQIVRRITSKGSVVSKSQAGFSTEDEAQLWGQKELESFLENLKQKNQRKAEQRN